MELKGDFQQLVPVGPDDRYRTLPYVVINDRNIPVDALGRFDTTLPGETRDLKVEMGDSLGRFLATTLPLPDLSIAQPALETLVHYGSSAPGIAVDAAGAGNCMLSGAVQPGSSLEIAGDRVELDREGRFALKFPLQAGERTFGAVLRNEAGCSKLMNLRVGSAPKPAAATRVRP